MYPFSQKYIVIPREAMEMVLLPLIVAKLEINRKAPGEVVIQEIDRKTTGDISEQGKYWR
jgi:hypothetical protein